VPTNTLSILAPVNRDIRVAKARTNTRTMTEVFLLLISVWYSRKTGISKIVTATQTAMSFATSSILAREKKWTSRSSVP
jgi:N-acyl-L-homoserine lactone synthetase